MRHRSRIARSFRMVVRQSPAVRSRPRARTASPRAPCGTAGRTSTWKPASRNGGINPGSLSAAAGLSPNKIRSHASSRSPAAIAACRSSPAAACFPARRTFITGCPPEPDQGRADRRDPVFEWRPEARDRRRRRRVGRINGGGGMAANPSGAHQVGRYQTNLVGAPMVLRRFRSSRARRRIIGIDPDR